MNADGSLGASVSPQRAVVGTTRTSAGHYNITFSGNVGICARWVNTTVADRTFAVGHLGNPQIMAVTVHDLTGASVDTTFTLNISCPQYRGSVGRWPGFDPGHPAAPAYAAGSADPSDAIHRISSAREWMPSFR